MAKNYLVPYTPGERSADPLARPDPLEMPTPAAAPAAQPVVTPQPDWQSKIGSAGVAMFDPFDSKIAVLPDGRRMPFMQAVKEGYDIRAATTPEAEACQRERYAPEALDAFGGNATLAKAFLRSLPTTAPAREVVRTVEPPKALSLQERVALKAKELRSEDRSARDHQLGRTLAYACDVATNHRIDIRQALHLCGVDPSRI